MKLKTHLTYALLFCALGTTAISCSKDENSLESTPKTEETEVNPKITKYLSISLGVKPEEIKFNKENQVFIIRTHHFDLKQVTKDYENANEYKATYETN